MFCCSCCSVVLLFMLFCCSCCTVICIVLLFNIDSCGAKSFTDKRIAAATIIVGSGVRDRRSRPFVLWSLFIRTYFLLRLSVLIFFSVSEPECSYKQGSQSKKWVYIQCSHRITWKIAPKTFSGRLEIYPCVPQDIGPLGPLPCSHSTSSADHSKQGIRYRWPCAILGWLVYYICPL